jgi:hypothetical protein
VLRPGTAVELKVLVDLRLLLAHGRLVEGNFQALFEAIEREQERRGNL